MVLSWFGGDVDVAGLIARRKYDKAAAVLQSQLDKGDTSSRLRKQLADVLIMSRRDFEAIPILRGLADDYASQGEAAKAIAILKKIQKIEPGRSDVESRLARLIKDKNRPRLKQGYDPRVGGAAEGYEPAGAVFSAEHFEQPSVAEQEKARVEAARQASWTPATHQEQSEEQAPLIQLPPPAPEPEPTTPAQVLDAVHQTMAPPAPVAPPEPVPEVEPEPETIETPLFQGFSEEELLAVMRGLELLSFEPGDIIITEGDPGDSLFILTTGVVKAFLKNQGAEGQRLVRTMAEGAFFGEISILSGKPRTATVTAATQCEILELDRPTLDGITKAYPRVQQVLEDFYIERATTQ